MAVLVMESEEVAEIECAGFARLKHRDIRFPLVTPRHVHAVSKDKIPEPERGEDQNHECQNARSVWPARNFP
jgi:hypothetical protein